MKFKPRYTITDTILNNISLIMTGREIIERAKLIPRWELKLKKEARIHNAHSSTSIEGNRLSLKQVDALSEHKDVGGSAKDKQEVINYLQTLDNIPRYARKSKIDIQLFLSIHKALTKGTLTVSADCGTFRTKQVFVGKRIFDGTQLKDVVEYMPPDTQDVPGLVSDFLEWLHSKDTAKVNPVILAGVVHYEFARIHPFIDGNGRTARLMASLILYKRGFDHRRFFALDDFYDEDRNSYYAALKTVQQSRGNITKWLEYFTEGVLVSINRVKDRIEKLSFAVHTDEIDQMELSPRQIKILERLQAHGRITNKELRTMFKVSRQAIVKEVAKLVQAKLVVLVGKGRGAYYQLRK